MGQEWAAGSSVKEHLPDVIRADIEAIFQAVCAAVRERDAGAQERKIAQVEQMIREAGEALEGELESE